MSKFESSVGQLNEDLGVKNESESIEREKLLSYEELSDLTTTFKEKMLLGEAELSAGPQSMLEFKKGEIEREFGKSCGEYQTYNILYNKPVDKNAIKKDFPGEFSVINFIHKEL